MADEAVWPISLGELHLTSTVLSLQANAAAAIRLARSQMTARGSDQVSDDHALTLQDLESCWISRGRGMRMTVNICGDVQLNDNDMHEVRQALVGAQAGGICLLSDSC